MHFKSITTIFLLLLNTFVRCDDQIAPVSAQSDGLSNPFSQISSSSDSIPQISSASQPETFANPFAQLSSPFGQIASAPSDDKTDKSLADDSPDESSESENAEPDKPEASAPKEPVSQLFSSDKPNPLTQLFGGGDKPNPLAQLFGGGDKPNPIAQLFGGGDKASPMTELGDKLKELKQTIEEKIQKKINNPMEQDPDDKLGQAAQELGEKVQEKVMSRGVDTAMLIGELAMNAILN